MNVYLVGKYRVLTLGESLVAVQTGRKVYDDRGNLLEGMTSVEDVAMKLGAEPQQAKGRLPSNLYRHAKGIMDQLLASTPAPKNKAPKRNPRPPRKLSIAQSLQQTAESSGLKDVSLTMGRGGSRVKARMVVNHNGKSAPVSFEFSFQDGLFEHLSVEGGLKTRSRAKIGLSRLRQAYLEANAEEALAQK